MSGAATHGHVVALGDFTPHGFATRPIRAYVPASLDLSCPHATLVLLDGQNVFGDHGSYAGGWHAHDAVNRLGKRDHWKPVIVAIPNAGQQRLQEYGSHVADFVAALVEGLLPRLGPGGPRVIGGSSMGGLAALYAWFHHPDRFDGAMVMSPSLWYGHRAAMHHILRGDWPIPALGRLYLDAGARERGRMFADAEALARGLAAMGPERLRWRPDPRGAHHERHWRRRLPAALRFLFRRG